MKLSVDKLTTIALISTLALILTCFPGLSSAEVESDIKARDVVKNFADADITAMEITKSLNMTQHEPLTNARSDGKDPKASQPASESKVEGTSFNHELYLISFHDHAENSHFDAVSGWLEAKSCNITESINETYIKFLVANMSKTDVSELEAKKAEFEIENIELDEFVWDSMDKSEL